MQAKLGLQHSREDDRTLIEDALKLLAAAGLYLTLIRPDTATSKVMP